MKIKNIILNTEIDMKRTVSRAFLLFCIFSICSCSTYSIQREIDEMSSLPNIKKAGIVFRLSRSSKITKEEFVRNSLTWLSVYQHKAEISVVADAGDPVGYFQGPQERFYQLSNENDFLKYKSIGILNLYLNDNKNELLNLFSRNNFDCLAIYEVYSIISPQMQFFEFESVLAVIDPNLNVMYLDHQAKYFDSDSTFANDLKNQIMDKITDRLMNDLRGMGILGGRIEKEKRSLSKDKAGKADLAGEKKAENTPEKTDPAEVLPESPPDKTANVNQ